MDLELGVKLTRASDEFDDFVSDFRLVKDRSGPLFLSREIYTLFLLTAHLKGYKRSDLKIDINEHGTLMAISGEKQGIETVTVGRTEVKREKEIKVFKKVFKIPNGVILDKIKATFNEDESILTVSMPKEVRGIRGTNIEEVKEIDNLAKQGSENLQIVDHKIQKPREKDDDLNDVDKGLQEQTHVKDVMTKEVENQNRVDCMQENNEANELERNKNNDKVLEQVNKAREDERETGFAAKRDGKRARGKICKLCTPIVAGSAVVIVSFVVFVVHIVRSKNQTRRKD